MIICRGTNNTDNYLPHYSGISSHSKELVFRQKVNNVYNIPSTKESIQYLHAAAGFPVKDSWIDAIKAGNYTTWPGLNVKVVNRYFPESDETQKGHMKKQRQNIINKSKGNNKSRRRCNT